MKRFLKRSWVYAGFVLLPVGVGYFALMGLLYIVSPKLTTTLWVSWWLALGYTVIVAQWLDFTRVHYRKYWPTSMLVLLARAIELREEAESILRLIKDSQKFPNTSAAAYASLRAAELYKFKGGVCDLETVSHKDLTHVLVSVAMQYAVAVEKNDKNSSRGEFISVGAALLELDKRLSELDKRDLPPLLHLTIHE